MSQKQTLLLLLLITAPILAATQERSEFPGRILAGKDISNRLPDLDSLLKKAEFRSPLLREHEAGIQIAGLQEKTQRQDWLRHLGLNLGWSYGQFDALTVNPDAVVGVAATTTSQTRYTIGAFVKMPAAAIANRKAEIQIAQLQEDQARFAKQNAKLELRQLVIMQYQDLIRAHRMMLIASERLESNKLLHSRAEREYLDGLISLMDYSRVQEMLTNATELFETRKIEFITAYLILQETTGVELNL